MHEKFLDPDDAADLFDYAKSAIIAWLQTSGAPRLRAWRLITQSLYWRFRSCFRCHICGPVVISAFGTAMSRRAKLVTLKGSALNRAGEDHRALVSSPLHRAPAATGGFCDDEAIVPGALYH